MVGAHESSFNIHIPFQVFGIDLSITYPILIMWGVVFFVFLFLFLGNKVRRFRLIEEYLFDFISEQIASEPKTKNKLWFSFLMTIFLFIIFGNLSGLIPGAVSPTSNINVTASLAIMVFLLTQILGIYTHGWRYFKHIVPSGIPKFLLVLMIPIEIVSQFARPFSLALRLFANVFAGHMILTIFIGFLIVVSPFIKVLPFSFIILISFFEIFVAFIQAFIFTFLSAFYIGESIQGGH